MILAAARKWAMCCLCLILRRLLAEIWSCVMSEESRLVQRSRTPPQLEPESHHIRIWARISTKCSYNSPPLGVPSRRALDKWHSSMALLISTPQHQNAIPADDMCIICIFDMI